MKLPRLSLRDLFWLVLVLALGLGWWLERDRIHALIEPIDRSWMTGQVSVEPYSNGTERGLQVSGEWPDAAPDLWIKGSLRLVQEDSADVAVWGIRGKPLSRFTSGGVSDYAGGSLRRLKHPDRPYQAVVDYEIWQGFPGRGKLLTKQSVLSDTISP